MLIAFISIGMRAAITISSTSVSVGGTTYQGYGIYGAKAGEIAQLLNGTYEGTISGANLNQLKSAEYIKLGDSQNPNVLKDEDLEALQLLSGAKFLDIDGSMLDDGADISKIKAGSAIEAVTLPNNLKKEQVNAAGDALTACNANFGSCLSLNTKMETVEKTFYPYTLGGVEYNYTGDLSALTDNGDGTYTYNVTSVDRALTNAEGYPVISYQNTDLNHMSFETNEGEIVMTDMGGWQRKDVKVSKFAVKVEGTEGSYYYVNPFTNTNVTITSDHYSEIVNKDGLKYIIVDFGDNYKTYPYQNGKFKYQYTNLAGETVFTEESSNPDDDMKITLPCNETVTITPETRTVTQPVEGGDCVAIAYVNTPGSLYKATSLDANDVASATGLVISGNINNGDISQGGNSGNSDDPQGNQHDSDAYESNGAISAFYFNPGAPIKSVDMSDAIIDDYKHLRVLNAYGANLESVVFPKTVTRIPNYCCYANGNSGNQNLANIVFPTEATTLQIGDYAFCDIAISDLVLPSSTTSVGNYAFYTCKKLEIIEMDPLKSSCTFGEFVFASTTVKHVTLSEGVDGISAHMFDACGSLESIRIPTTAKKIKTAAFSACVSLHKLVIPEGVEEFEKNVFNLAGLTDIYVMATSADKVPKIYDVGNSGDTEGTFTKRNILGNNTAPNKTYGTDYDEATSEETALSWYQEEFSDMNFGIGGNNCMIQLHYPENMKSFYNGVENIPANWSDNLISYADKNLAEWQVSHAQEWISEIYALGSEEYYGAGHNSASKLGPTEGNLYWPKAQDYYIRLAIGYTPGDEPTAAAWRQIPLQGIASADEFIYTKKYDDTWYTMCFPWDMDDNTLFSTFNQKCEIVEFVGAEVFKDPKDEYNYNLVFHFDEVAKTRYMPEDHSAEYRRIVSEHTRSVEYEANGSKFTRNYYTYEDIKTGDLVYWPYHTGSSASDAEKEMQKKYNDIMHMMVFAGHPYMIHPSIGAKAGQPKNCTIAGVKKFAVGDKYEGVTYNTLADLANAQKVERTVTSKEAGSTAEAEAWKNPVTGKGGKYTFIGNINDEVNGDKGVQDMPTANGPVYFLGVKPGTVYPQFFKKPQGKGAGKWSQYSAIIVPDADAVANVEGLDGMKVTNPDTPAKGYDVAFGEWEVVDEATVVTAIENAQAEAEETGKPAQITHMNVVYNIKGQVVRADSSSVEGLPKGLYIVNGKKYMVK